ncbi:MAG: GcrA family cell cycle regulator [Hyphomonadaceae bacterium]|nr:GcrA family cell cycle regulator [Hyphomonadaceae bacterium]
MSGAREAALQARIDDLEFQLEELRAALAPPGWTPPQAWGLRPAEAAAMGVLVARPRLTVALWLAARADCADGPGDPGRLLSVHVCVLRRRLAPFGIEIKTLWGEGYALDAGVREALAGGAVSVGPPVARGRRRPPTWTADVDAALRAAWLEGASAAAIAAQLGVSRNAVCGRLARLGLRRAPGSRRGGPRGVAGLRARGEARS